jgi:hypothetical protein
MWNRREISASSDHDQSQDLHPHPYARVRARARGGHAVRCWVVVMGGQPPGVGGGGGGGGGSGYRVQLQGRNYRVVTHTLGAGRPSNATATANTSTYMACTVVGDAK